MKNSVVSDRKKSEGNRRSRSTVSRLPPSEGISPMQERVSKRPRRQKNATPRAKVVMPENVVPPSDATPIYHRDMCTIPEQTKKPKTVLRVEVPTGRVMYINKIGHKFPNSKFLYILEYDKTLWKKWNYSIGTVSEPWTLEPSITVHDWIQFSVKNKSGINHSMEALFSGWMAPSRPRRSDMR